MSGLLEQAIVRTQKQLEEALETLGEVKRGHRRYGWEDDVREAVRSIGMVCVLQSDMIENLNRRIVTLEQKLDITQSCKEQEEQSENRRPDNR